MRGRTVILPLATAVLLVVGITAASAQPPHPVPVGPDRTVTVMARNLYFGADLAPVLAATSPEQFLDAAVGAFQQAQASDFPSRAAAIADEIATEGPALVGIQEATWWRTGPLGDPAPAEDVLVDFVEMIVAELEAAGHPYEVAGVAEGFDAELPVRAVGLDVRLTVGDALLVRSDLPTSQLKVSDVRSGHYATTITFDSPIGPLEFPRQWVAADVKIRGKEFRFVTTHLEAFSAPVRTAQAVELLHGPAATSLPVVAVGDFNAPITAAGDASATLLDAGFADAWNVVRPGEPGLTCCFDPDLRDPAAELRSRIDLVLTRGGFRVVDVRRVGVDPDPTLSPLGVLYPSDHAGVVADLVLP